ncbi:MAG: hypothetical protein E7270_05655 [Lachnospiraceae bacterium]|nr:hypothetical protein [Lachnospiraceae bacterium]
MLSLVYNCFSGFFLTKEFCGKIEKRMNILYPGARELVIRKTAITLCRVFSMGVLSVMALMFFADISLYYSVITATIVYVVSVSIVYNGLDKIETKMLIQLEQFITDVRYRFRFDGMIDDALEDAINSAEYEMSLHGQLILDTLKENVSKTYDEPYKEYAPNHFFLTFYVMCETVMIYGDKYINGNSMFLKNISYLKEDIHIELLKRKKIQNEFMGLTGITILPVFAIKPIEVWALSNMPELIEEYQSIKGTVLTILLVLFSVMIFMIIKRLKYSVDLDNVKSEWVKKMLSISFVEKFLLSIISANYEKYFKMDRMLKSVVYKYNIKEFLLVRIVYSFVAGMIANIVGISIGLDIFSLAFGIMAMLVTYISMYISIVLKRQMILIMREDEVVRFQTIILILMHMDRITVEQILEQMEAFAVVFKDTLEKISDHLVFKGKKAFEEAKDEVSFVPFERLIDAFIASDRIGISSAFEDVEGDRAYYVEKHKQENEELVKNKALIAKFIAFIPLCSVIIIKLILPFVIMGMEQVGSFEFNI